MSAWPEQSNLRARIGPIIYVIGVACLVVATTALALGLLAARDVRFDTLNIILPAWAVIGLLGYALAGWASRWRSIPLVALLACILALTLPSLARNWPRRPQGSRGATLRIVQFNAFKHNRNPQAAAAWLLRQKPDIITMEESLGPSRLILRELESAYPFQISCLSNLRCSTVILSRIRPVASGGLARGDPENQRALSAAWARFEMGGDPFTIVAVHLTRTWPWGDQSSGRRQLLEFMSHVDRQRLIVAGDFNLTPWMTALRQQDEAFGVPRLTRALPTWPTAPPNSLRPPPLLPIDHIYAGPDWNMTSLSRGPWLGSDHAPLLITLVDTASAMPERRSP